MGEGQREVGRERESSAGSMPTTEPIVGLNLMTLTHNMS